MHALFVDRLVNLDEVTSPDEDGLLLFEEVRHDPWFGGPLAKSSFEEDFKLLSWSMLLILFAVVFFVLADKLKEE